MRLLADENFPRPVVRMLRLQGHDVVSITETTRGIDDLEVLARTSTEGGEPLGLGRIYLRCSE